MKPLFASTALQKQFEEDGFVKISLLSPADVNELLAEYRKVAGEHERINIPYITTSHSNNPALIKQVDGILQKVIAPALDTILINYKLLFGNYLVKMPGPDSETEPHQDITFVDESNYASVNVWVALQDTDEKNGCMYFLNGSHRFMPTIRPTHDYKWAYAYVKDEVKKHSRVFPAKAGDAFIFNHAVIHGSFANKSNQPRIAAVIAAYNADAGLIHYYLPDMDGKMLQKYSMTKEAYLHFKKQQPPAKGVFIGEEYYDFRQLNVDEFNLMTTGTYRQRTLLHKISRLFRKTEGA